MKRKRIAGRKGRVKNNNLILKKQLQNTNIISIRKGGWARSSSLEKNTVARNFLDNEWYRRNTDSDRDALASQLLRYAGYKVDGLLLECARDGTIVNSWLYVGMWLSDFTPGSYSMSGSSSPSQVTATITVDQITQAADDFKILTKSTAISGLGYTILPQDSTTL